MLSPTSEATPVLCPPPVCHALLHHCSLYIHVTLQMTKKNIGTLAWTFIHLVSLCPPLVYSSNSVIIRPHPHLISVGLVFQRWVSELRDKQEKHIRWCLRDFYVVRERFFLCVWGFSTAVLSLALRQNHFFIDQSVQDLCNILEAIYFLFSL